MTTQTKVSNLDQAQEEVIRSYHDQMLTLLKGFSGSFNASLLTDVQRAELQLTITHVENAIHIRRGRLTNEPVTGYKNRTVIKK